MMTCRSDSYGQANPAKGMSDRYHSLTVVLEIDMRDEDVREIVSSIKMIRGVLSVSPYAADLISHVAEKRARLELGEKIIAVIYPDKTKE